MRNRMSGFDREARDAGNFTAEAKHGCRISPAAGAGKALGAWSRSVMKAVEEEDPAMLLKPSVEGLGCLFVLPLKQAMIACGNLYDYATGVIPDFQLRDVCSSSRRAGGEGERKAKKKAALCGGPLDVAFGTHESDWQYSGVVLHVFCVLQTRRMRSCSPSDYPLKWNSALPCRPMQPRGRTAFMCGKPWNAALRISKTPILLKPLNCGDVKGNKPCRSP